MAVIIRNKHLEHQIRREAKKRGHATLSKTASELLIERLTSIQDSRRLKAKAAA